MSQVTSYQRDAQKLCHISEIPPGARKTFTVKNRDILVIHHPNMPGTLYALDQHCFHYGGPLDAGRIEVQDIEDSVRLLVQCPWHNYVIDCETGGHIDKDLNSQYQCHHGRQRTHKIKADAKGILYVLLSQRVFGNADSNRDSDKYNDPTLKKNSPSKQQKVRGRKNLGPAAARRQRLARQQQRKAASMQQTPGRTNTITNYFNPHQTDM